MKRKPLLPPSPSSSTPLHSHPQESRSLDPAWLLWQQEAGVEKKAKLNGYDGEKSVKAQDRVSMVRGVIVPGAAAEGSG